ncbi:Uncharacterised protein [Salmonella enterica subsp. arizonae]|nr:Uncharacterised protein [Salmonella enterica subsp. arizonae]
MFEIKLQNYFSKIIVNRVKVTFRHIKYFCERTHHLKCRAMYSSFVLRYARTRSFFLNTSKNAQFFLS